MNTVAAGSDPVPPAVPRTVRGAGIIVAGQAAAALSAAAVLLVRGLGGADQHAVNGYGTAVWFVLVGTVMLAAARALRGGRRWGRGIAVFANLLLLPIAWYVGVGSHRFGYAAGVLAVAVAVLGLLFSPGALRWAAGSAPAPPESS